MRSLRILGCCIVVGIPSLSGCAGEPRPAGPPPDAETALELPLAELNDNREPAGRMVGDTLVVELELVRVAWSPRGGGGPRIPVAAFAELGGRPMVPGPLIRTRVGTPIRLSLVNGLDVTARFDRQVSNDMFSSLFGGESVEPGDRVDLVWTPDAPLTTVYAGRDGSPGPNGSSMGVIVVDPAGTPPDPDERILHITSWGSPLEPGSLDRAESFKLFVNGRSWPFTERLEYTVGDTVRWRVVNSSLVRHPMHLHGFYFTVTSSGDLSADTLFQAERLHPVVTHTLTNLASMTLEWVPETSGNWLFHCHLIRHMGPTQRFAAEPPPESDGRAMAGLVTGITIHPPPEGAPPEAMGRRRLDLWTGTAASEWTDGSDRLSFVLQRDQVPPAVDSTEAPSSLLVLERDEAVEIVLHNRLQIPLSTHWHGLELPSRYDGVGYWSGTPGSAVEPVASGDSRIIVLEPPRAGTFMYHTHGEPGHELSQGLYGPLVVLEPGEEHNPAQDRFFLLASGGGERDAPPALNGVLEPGPEYFDPERTYRLRFGQIAADESKLVRLLFEGQPVRWTPVAKDGADLPDALRTPVPAEFSAEVGETMDFEWTPARGLYQLEITTVAYPLGMRRGPRQTVAFVVGAVPESEVAAAHEGYQTVVSDETLFLGALAGVALVLLLAVTLVAWWLVRAVRSRRTSAA